MKFRYISFINKVKDNGKKINGSKRFLKQINYLDRYYGGKGLMPLRRVLYFDSQDFFRKYGKIT